jgi:hypothetical protein
MFQVIFLDIALLSVFSVSTLAFLKIIYKISLCAFAPLLPLRYLNITP